MINNWKYEKSGENNQIDNDQTINKTKNNVLDCRKHLH